MVSVAAVLFFFFAHSLILSTPYAVAPILTHGVSIPEFYGLVIKKQYVGRKKVITTSVVVNRRAVSGRLSSGN